MYALMHIHTYIHVWISWTGERETNVDLCGIPVEQALIKISHKSEQICSLKHKCHKLAKIRLSSGRIYASS